MSEKLTCKDLMVGDWVAYDKANMYIAQIKEIRQTQDGEEFYINCLRDFRDPLSKKYQLDSFNVEILRPIPITNEILEKNGFEHQHNIGYVYEDGYGWKVVYETFDNTLKIFSNYDMLFNITFFDRIAVHELQHVLKVCKIDKEIEL